MVSGWDFDLPEGWNVNLNVIHSEDETFARAHNDRTAALFRDDVDTHVKAARNTLESADGEEVTALAVIAGTLIEATDAMPRERLASMLAVALIRLAKLTDNDG